MFNGNEEHRISPEEASRYTARYRATHSDDSIIGLYYSRQFIESVLDQPDCIGIRLYFGENSDDQTQLIITGVNKDGDDISSGIIGELGLPCPPYCGKENRLNTSN